MGMATETGNTESTFDFRQLTAGAADHLSRTGRPLVTLTYAQSLDGCIAIRRDEQLTLSGPESMRMTHQLRASNAGIMVGIGTILADNPRLRLKYIEGNDPQPVILDSNLRFPGDARMLDNPIKPWLICSQEASKIRQQALEQHGVCVIRASTTPEGRVDLADALNRLGHEGMTSVMVEGGTRIITSFLKQGLADVFVLTIAPLFVGELRAVESLNIVKPEHLPRLQNMRSEQMGDDLVLWGRF